MSSAETGLSETGAMPVRLHKASGEGSSPVDASMVEGEKSNLSVTRQVSYNFTISSDMMLADNLIGQLHRELHAVPQEPVNLAHGELLCKQMFGLPLKRETL